jgi:hypothetical protein
MDDKEAIAPITSVGQPAEPSLEEEGEGETSSSYNY